MLLTWKDFATTLLTLSIVLAYYFQSNNIVFPFIQSVRWTIVLIGIIGISICALGSTGISPEKSMWITAASFLGITSFVIILWGLITGARITIPLLIGSITLLWFITTIRHIFNL
jgi:hypothetical protein